jgi:hemerythrin
MNHERFVWTKDLEIGVPELDEQHKYFYDIGNMILDLHEKPNITKAEMLIAVGEMGDYALYHFNTEEEMLKKLGGPGAEAHLVKHAAFRDEIIAFVTAIEREVAEDQQIADKVAEFARSYIKKHMLNARNENILK